MDARMGPQDARMGPPKMPEWVPQDARMGSQDARMGPQDARKRHFLTHLVNYGRLRPACGPVADLWMPELI